jgi:hypothetical protein
LKWDKRETFQVFILNKIEIICEWSRSNWQLVLKEFSELYKNSNTFLKETYSTNFHFLINNWSKNEVILINMFLNVEATICFFKDQSVKSWKNWKTFFLSTTSSSSPLPVNYEGKQQKKLLQYHGNESCVLKQMAEKQKQKFFCSKKISLPPPRAFLLVHILRVFKSKTNNYFSPKNSNLVFLRKCALFVINLSNEEIQNFLPLHNIKWKRLAIHFTIY